ncbi:MAG: sugar transferase [Candidatus Eremiobacteraeota bacterium]|nr:sugar transferase [Candidatus Eremiobacteraeota bacterium]
MPRSWDITKRFMDVTIAGAALVMFAPIVALAALGIACVSKGSPLFLQERVGKDGTRFRLFKLRTMVEGAHLNLDDVGLLNEVDGPVFKIRNDPRLHPLGKLLRRTSIDELPNLINVLRGEMSIVGPRPPLRREVDHYDEYALRRLTVKPGVTCLWQISGRSNLGFDEWMRLDNAYIDSWTPLADLAIIARTVPAVLRGEGAH